MFELGFHPRIIYEVYKDENIILVLLIGKLHRIGHSHRVGYIRRCKEESAGGG